MEGQGGGREGGVAKSNGVEEWRGGGARGSSMAPKEPYKGSREVSRLPCVRLNSICGMCVCVGYVDVCVEKSVYAHRVTDLYV